MFDSLLSKCIAGVVALATVGTVFAVLSINDEDATCRGAGYGAYDDATGTCKVEGEHADSVVIVAGNTANSPKPEFTNKNSWAYQYLKNSIAKNATIKTVSVAPDLKVETIETNLGEASDAAGFIASVEQTMEQINQIIGQAPTMNGATYLEAISKAGRDCVSAKKSTKKSNTEETDENNDGAAVLVIGSGLSDGGILNFADDDLLLKEPSAIVSKLERACRLTYDLDGVKVIWSNIGETEAPQEELESADIDNLKEIYKQVLRRRGVSEIVFDDTIKEHNSIENNQYTVKTSKVSPVIEIKSKLLFKADSAELIDRTAARQDLSQVFDYATSHPSKRIIVTGYMASGNCNGQANTELAGERAKTVKRFLIENGVDNDVEAINGGVFEPNKSECDNNGSWQPSLADYRRKVAIEFK